MTEVFERDLQSAPARSARTRREALDVVPWWRWVGHAGYIAEGVIYLLIGGFALLAAVEPSQEPNGSKGSLERLDAEPFGHAMLAVLALGLAAFVFWQVIVAVIDPEHRRGRYTFNRLAARAGHLCNGALHAVLVGQAIWRLLGIDVGGDDKRAQAVWTGRVLALPHGRWMVAAAGTGFVVLGLFQIYRAVTHKKMERVDLTHAKLRRLIVTFGTLGFFARGVLLGLIGAYLVDAARRSDTTDASGVAGALSALKRLEYGPWLLGMVAVGLICYGCAQILKEPYRNFRAS